MHQAEHADTCRIDKAEAEAEAGRVYTGRVKGPGKLAVYNATREGFLRPQNSS